MGYELKSTIYEFEFKSSRITAGFPSKYDLSVDTRH